MITVKLTIIESNRSSYEYEQLIFDRDIALATSRYKVLEMIAQAGFDLVERMVTDFTKRGWV